jgi:hypothetical protein
MKRTDEKFVGDVMVAAASISDLELADQNAVHDPSLAPYVGERRIGESAERLRRRRSAAMTGQEDRYKPLLARRVPRDSIVLGRAYVIHARNGGVGVAVEKNGCIGYRLHRVKFTHHYLFTEYDWDDDPSYGTAIPLRLIAAEPPTDNEELLAWLANQQEEHRAEFDAAWEVVLGFPPSRLRGRKDR